MDFGLEVLTEIQWDEFFAKYLSKKGLDGSYRKIRKYIKSHYKKKSIEVHEIDFDEVIHFLKQHIVETSKWASEISFRDMIGRKNLDSLFIELDFTVTPRNRRFPKQKLQTIGLSEALNLDNGNIIILGQPGAGKTTTIKKVFIDSIRKEKSIYQNFGATILIRLKKLKDTYRSNQNILKEEILSYFGLDVQLGPDLFDLEKPLIYKNIFFEFIDSTNSLFLFDGFDEIPDWRIRQRIIDELEEFAIKLHNTRFILTSRSADFELHISNITNTRVFEIDDLGGEQIREFCNKWFKNEELGAAVYDEIMSSPFADVLLRPLNLAHLCALYENDKKIPDNPYSVYMRIIHLLLEDWTNQQGVKRISAYGKFKATKKEKFLSNLSYELTVNNERSYFTRSTLNKIYQKICTQFSLPQSSALEVIHEIESHTGIVIKSSFDTFEFSHKSLQEYLTALHLNNLPYLLKDKEALKKIPNECAIWIALSGDANFLLFHIIRSLNNYNTNPEVLNPLISRLRLEKPEYNNNPLAFIALSMVRSNLYVQGNFPMPVFSGTEEDVYRNRAQIITDYINYVVVIKNSRVAASKYYNLDNLKNDEINQLKHFDTDLKFTAWTKNDVKYWLNHDEVELPPRLILPAIDGH